MHWLVQDVGPKIKYYLDTDRPNDPYLIALVG